MPGLNDQLRAGAEKLAARNPKLMEFGQKIQQRVQGGAPGQMAPQTGARPAVPGGGPAGVDRQQIMTDALARHKAAAGMQDPGMAPEGAPKPSSPFAGMGPEGPTPEMLARKQQMNAEAVARNPNGDTGQGVFGMARNPSAPQLPPAGQPGGGLRETFGQPRPPMSGLPQARPQPPAGQGMPMPTKSPMQRGSFAMRTPYNGGRD